MGNFHTENNRDQTNSSYNNKHSIMIEHKELEKLLNNKNINLMFFIEHPMTIKEPINCIFIREENPSQNILVKSFIDIFYLDTKKVLDISEIFAESNRKIYNAYMDFMSEPQPNYKFHVKNVYSHSKRIFIVETELKKDSSFILGLWALNRTNIREKMPKVVQSLILDYLKIKPYKIRFRGEQLKKYIYFYFHCFPNLKTEIISNLNMRRYY